MEGGDMGRRRGERWADRGGGIREGGYMERMGEVGR